MDFLQFQLEQNDKKTIKQNFFVILKVTYDGATSKKLIEPRTQGTYFQCKFAL